MSLPQSPLPRRRFLSKLALAAIAPSIHNMFRIDPCLQADEPATSADPRPEHVEQLVLEAAKVSDNFYEEICTPNHSLACQLLWTWIRARTGYAVTGELNLTPSKDVLANEAGSSTYEHSFSLIAGARLIRDAPTLSISKILHDRLKGDVSALCQTIGLGNDIDVPGAEHRAAKGCFSVKMQGSLGGDAFVTLCACIALRECDGLLPHRDEVRKAITNRLKSATDALTRHVEGGCLYDILNRSSGRHRDFGWPIPGGLRVYKHLVNQRVSENDHGSCPGSDEPRSQAYAFMEPFFSCFSQGILPDNLSNPVRLTSGQSPINEVDFFWNKASKTEVTRSKSALLTVAYLDWLDHRRLKLGENRLRGRIEGMRVLLPAAAKDWDVRIGVNSKRKLPVATNLLSIAPSVAAPVSSADRTLFVEVPTAIAGLNLSEESLNGQISLWFREKGRETSFQLLPLQDSAK